MLTWAQMEQQEPRLKDLLTKVKSATSQLSEDDADLLWFNELKDEMAELVGQWRTTPRYPELATTKAYDLAYRKLYYETMCQQVTAHDNQDF